MGERSDRGEDEHRDHEDEPQRHEADGDTAREAAVDEEDDDRIQPDRDEQSQADDHQHARYVGHAAEQHVRHADAQRSRKPDEEGRAVVERASKRTEGVVGRIERALDVRRQYQDIRRGLARFRLTGRVFRFRSHHAPATGRCRVSGWNASSTEDKYPPTARQNEVAPRD